MFFGHTKVAVNKTDEARHLGSSLALQMNDMRVTSPSQLGPWTLDFV